MTRLLISTLLLFATAAVGFAGSFDPAARHLPPLNATDRTRLAAGDRVSTFYEDPAGISLLPDTAYSAQIRASLTDLAPSIGVETLYLLPLPDDMTRQPDFLLRVYNVLRSISTMEGIEYYSASRDRMRVFYVESFAVADPESRRPIGDPLVTRVPAVDRVYAYQEDSSFGRNTYELRYRHHNGQLGLTMVNLTRMSYGILPLVRPGNLEIHLTVIPAREGLLFYGNCGVRVMGLFGMQDRVQASFQNRIDAIYRWFSSRISTEFAL